MNTKHTIRAQRGQAYRLYRNMHWAGWVNRSTKRVAVTYTDTHGIAMANPFYTKGN